MDRDVITELDEERESLGGLLGRLVGQVSALIGAEIELAKQELREKLRPIYTGLVLMVVAAVFAQAALLTLCAAAVIGLTAYVSLGASALIIGMACAVIGGLAAVAALRQFKQTTLKLEKTLQSMKENRAWLQELM